MSRYQLKIGKRKEVQRNSGLWVATSVGSSGAIRSAGGRLLKSTDKRFQYKPRELYAVNNKKYALTGAIVSNKARLDVVSLMTEGIIYVDGSHYRVPFPFGERASISKSAEPLRMIKAS